MSKQRRLNEAGLIRQMDFFGKCGVKHLNKTTVDIFSNFKNLMFDISNVPVREIIEMASQ